MTDDDLARRILGTLQDAVSAQDLDRMTALLHRDAVLIGTKLYSTGADAVREYLRQEVVDIDASLYWDLPDLDVFLSRPDAIGFSGDGRITVTSPAGDVVQFPFRLTVVAEQADDAWLIRLFHGSLPSAN
jgi:ketosteroid isomerase-like protein